MIIRYFLVGGVAAAVDIGIFALFARTLGFPWFTVAIVGFVLATLVNYALSVRHVFDSGVRFRPSLEIMLTFAVSAVGLLINQGVLWYFIEKVHTDLLIAKLVATGLVFFWNYFGRKHFIFNPHSPVPGYRQTLP